MKNFFYEFLDNLAKIFNWPNFLWHMLAMALTYFSVTTGFDWYYFSVTRSISFDWLWNSAGIFGFLVPFFMPLTLYIVGKFRNNLTQLNTACALGQAVILGWFISSFYKVFTGRNQPDLNNVYVDISHGFRFGVLEGGIFWGWPSTHTTIAFAMIVTLLILYPKKRKIKYVGLLYAFYIGFGASIGFHWFSEFISGIIIGVVIGIVVGKSFQRRFYVENIK